MKENDPVWSAEKLVAYLNGWKLEVYRTKADDGWLVRVYDPEGGDERIVSRVFVSQQTAREAAIAKAQKAEPQKPSELVEACRELLDSDGHDPAARKRVAAALKERR